MLRHPIILLSRSTPFQRLSRPPVSLLLTSSSPTLLHSTKNRSYFSKSSPLDMSTSSRPGSLQIGRFCSFYDLTVTPRLYGISVMGRRLAFYSMEKDNGHIVPEEVPTTADYVVDTVPAIRWQLDIMTDEGHQQFMDVVNDVKSMVAAI